MEDCQRWVLLGDAENAALAWLQSLERPEVALGVVSPRRFVADYQVRVAKREIVPLGLENPNDAQVLVIISNVGGALALNLKAPLVIHLAERVGRQIVARDDHAVQHRLAVRRQAAAKRRKRQFVIRIRIFPYNRYVVNVSRDCRVRRWRFPIMLVPCSSSPDSATKVSSLATISS